MECKKCGAVLEEDSVFCTNCGARVEDDSEQAAPVQEVVVTEVDTTPQKVEKSKPKVSKEKIISLIAGTLLIGVGISRVLSAGTSISSTSFGGDFYTYTYRGIVAINEQMAEIQVSLGWVITAIGAAIDLRALRN